MKNIIKQYSGILIGVLLIVVAIKMFFAPHDIAAGGIGGLSLIVERVFNINMSITTFILNTALLIIGAILLGKAFLLKTAFGTMLVPAYMAIIPELTLSDDILLSVFMGALLTAVGVDILYRNNASSGGTTIPPLIFKKYFGIPTSIGLFATDAVIVGISGYAFGIESFMYAVLVILLTSVIMETISNGISRKKVIYIISTKQLDIEKTSMDITGRGVTRLKAYGGYTQESRDISMIVCNDRDLDKIQHIIKEKDPKAFVIVQNANSVQGEGFSYRSVVE
ncbi:YitT family protein [Mycoplasma sp. P36-A1]|uniref:YitT family protein n=1 Tax=Mycoplasma sp. P36-A1 TaxID=3252900 RepID=UPI003C2DCF36